ncbi:tripartite motif-containing protein 46-like [Neophocaena asiaeorientalis asiaeorientalis]|uniref:Tripartite motif-containing protein 46-like n=1 Tax=Neophocaena asiaeorientalis asiaeorientalis TaxID=1706337 RepID=A0A341BMQ5_NEOAA|nr:tripartite motif-containing protein 46-like [Neophocaena asiaeorientalis asiaeorientalis]
MRSDISPHPSPHPHRAPALSSGFAAAAGIGHTGAGGHGRAMAEGEDMQAFTSIMDALVRISTSMKNMEKELLCPVCQEMYKQPLVLPCTHNVCQACAREVLGQQGYVGHGGDPSSEPTSPASTPSFFHFHQEDGRGPSLAKGICLFFRGWRYCPSRL